MQDLVSIVVPIYNQELYLDRSITSLTKQTYDNIEIIAVNDGSTDNSLKILQKYASTDSRIIIVSEENGGLVQATITGINKTTGEYICFCDPDDYVGADFVETFIKHIGNADFIACGFYRDSNGVVCSSYLDRDYIYSANEISELQHTFLTKPGKLAVSKEIYISRWNKLYKTSCVRKIIEDYSTCRDVSLGEDSIFTYLMLKHCSSGVTKRNANSYYYNIKSQTSMMGHTENYTHVRKAHNAYEHLLRLENKYDDKKYSQAYELYYFLIESLFQRLKGTDKNDFSHFYKMLKQDSLYKKTLKYLLKRTLGKERMKLLLRIMIDNPQIYLKMSEKYGQKQ